MAEPRDGLSAEQKHFLARRIHSLLGIVPLGGFLFFHLFENSRAMFGPGAYDEMVATIGGLPYLKIIEWFALFLPILAHGVYGVVIALQAKRTLRLSIYNASGTWRFWLQRATGVILIAFILYHVGTTRIAIAYLGQGSLDGHLIQSPSFAFMTQHFNHAWWVKPFYGLGILSAAYHLGNGIWSFAIVWGITVRKQAQDACLKFVAVPVFLALTAMGWYTLAQFPKSSSAPSAPISNQP